MGEKVKSYLVSKDEPGGLKQKYEEIYGQSDVWLYKKSHGAHSVILQLIKDYLPGKKVLDVGCGAGRLPLMCGTLAREVHAFDFSEAAIFIARKNAEAVGQEHVQFWVSDMDFFENPDGQPYDLITLAGVLEHVPDPLATLRRLSSLLGNNGLLMVSCPNFLNFRGHTYMTLLTLLDLPMSLADLRQVSYMDIRRWASEVGFQVECCAGAIYRFAWDGKAVEDMIKRVPAAIGDKQLPIEIHFESYNQWLKSMVEINRWYLEFLESQGFLKRIVHPVRLEVAKRPDVDEELWGKMNQYLNEDIESDPYWSDIEPFCYQGGEVAYLLRKV